MGKNSNVHFRQEAEATARAIVDVAFVGTGAAPGAAPTAVTDGFGCRDLVRVDVAVSADQASSVGLEAVITPWFWIPVDADPAGGAETYAWHKGSPMTVPLDYSGDAGQVVRIDCEFADRMYLQVVPPLACAWARAKCFVGFLRGEASVMVGGITAADLIDALLTVFKGPVPIKATVSAMQRTARAASNLPQTAQTPYFAVSGRVLIYGVIGTVTTIVQDLDDNARIIANPTVGADKDMSVDANIRHAAVGTTLSISGDPTDPLTITVSGFVEYGLIWATLLMAGTIDFKCDANRTGQTEWTVLWEPVDPGATVTAI